MFHYIYIKFLGFFFQPFDIDPLNCPDVYFWIWIDFLRTTEI